MPSPIELDLNHWVRIVPTEGRSQVVKNIGFACYYANTAAFELASEGTELALNATVTIEGSGKWFRTKKATATEIQTPSLLEVQPATNPETISAGELNGALMGFFKATPVAQPKTTGTVTGVTLTGTSITEQLEKSTFTGGKGATAYTLSDVVLALKQLGLLKE